MTFHTLSSVDRSKIERSLANFGVGLTAFSMLQNWYKSMPYSMHFDYSRSRIFTGKTWSHIKGIVSDIEGDKISDVEVALFMGRSKIATTTTNDSGSYEILRQFDNSLLAEDLSLKIVSSQYASNEHPIQISDLVITKDFVRVTPMNRVYAEFGGEAVSRDKSIVVKFPPGALSQTTTFNVSNSRNQRLHYGGNDRPSEVFEITPDFDFDQPVVIEFTLNSRVKKKLGILGQTGESVYIGALNGNKVELLSNILYNPATSILRAETDHFTRFVIFSCNRMNRCQFVIPPAEYGSYLLSDSRLGGSAIKSFPSEYRQTQSALNQEVINLGLVADYRKYATLAKTIRLL